MDYIPDIKSYFVKPETSSLLVIESINKHLDPFLWLQANKMILEKNLLKYGGILYTGERKIAVAMS